MYTLTYKGFISAIKNIWLNKVHTSTNNKNQNDAEYWDFYGAKDITNCTWYNIFLHVLSTRLETDKLLCEIYYLYLNVIIQLYIKVTRKNGRKSYYAFHVDHKTQHQYDSNAENAIIKSIFCLFLWQSYCCSATFCIFVNA